MSAQPQSSRNDSGQSPWQDRLSAYCDGKNLNEPSYQEFSDRRGGRTAWSCQVVVEGRSFAARNWYDGTFIKNAREDAAEVALKTLDEDQPDESSAQGRTPWNQ